MRTLNSGSERSPRNAKSQECLGVLQNFGALPAALEELWDPNLPEGALLCILLTKRGGASPQLGRCPLAELFSLAWSEIPRPGMK